MRNVLAFLVCLTMANVAKAGFDYSFEAALSSDATTLGNLSFGTGTAPVDLTVYLVQRPNGADVPTLFNSAGANVAVNQVGGTANTVRTNNSLFTFKGVAGSTFTNGTFPPPGIASGLVNGVHAIEVGSLAISGPLGSVANFDFADPIGDAVDVNGTFMDATVFANSGSIAVSVPEPTSFAVLGLGSLGLAFVRRRRA